MRPALSSPQLALGLAGPYSFGFLFWQRSQGFASPPQRAQIARRGHRRRSTLGYSLFPLPPGGFFARLRRGLDFSEELRAFSARGPARRATRRSGVP